ncbi:MAG: efflux RND transporter periplasmic adaptor subunit [Acidobacteria bacterium]|nr:efflux RND transporter periplasmic adaptor subunit [Acidobacteriota bacterium]
MTKRMIQMLLVAAAFIAVIGAIKYRQIRGSIAQASFQLPPEAVTTIIADEAQWQSMLTSIATVTAIQGVIVSADLPGVVSKISFDSGKAVQAGDILVELDARQEQAQLAAAEAQRKLARLSIDRIRGLHRDGVVSQSDLDAAEAELDQAHAKVGEITAEIERKTIRAPFTGILGIRQVNIGQYLRSGDPIVPLQSLNPIYVTFGVPQQEVGKLRIGAAVRVTAEGMTGAGLTGRITAVDSVVDRATRNMDVQATLENPGAALRPGMFVEVRVLLDTETSVVAIPSSAINYAPYGDSVFVVEEMKGPTGQAYRGVRQQFVKRGRTQGDQVAILSGVEPGDEIVTSGVFKLRNGGAVTVNNEVQPANNPQPNPEDS